MNEFELIQTYFQKTPPREDILLPNGDDAAIVQCQAGCALVAAADTIVSGRHFLEDADPKSIGHRIAAVNLSDLAAMGASPAWCLLALSLPEINTQWLDGFCEGFYTLANKHQLALIGGDTTQGPLTITLTILGQVPVGKALTRSGAKVGDSLYLSGPLGAQDYPQPCVDIGKRLCGLANSCIDISDGFAADVGHLLKQSNVGVVIDVNQIPTRTRWQDTINTGDDYQLCFSASPLQHDKIMALDKQIKKIGELSNVPGLVLQDGEVPIKLDTQGYQHF